jgi:Mechanosensitive ion channel
MKGVMFILGRNPYDVGDRISINGPNDLPLPDGVATWYVQEVTLYYTTVRLGATNEVATISNSSLASCRIVNAARSKKAVVHVRVKFSLEVPFSKIQIFKETIEAFVKARPREWLSCSSIRMSSVEGNLGYFEYVISLNHRDSWQQVGNILGSKAAVINYCLEVQRQLDIKYVAPATCVDLNMKNIDAFRQSDFFSDDVRVGDVDEKNA